MIIGTGHSDLFILYNLPVFVHALLLISICLFVCISFKTKSCYVAQDWPETHNSLASASRMLNYNTFLLKVQYDVLCKEWS